MVKVLTIAGSDSSGGAGIQADIKTIFALRAYPITVICALTAQSSMGVDSILEVPPDFVVAQMESVISDMSPQAAKTGMLLNAGVLVAVATALGRYRLPLLVVDPVMLSSTGRVLLESDGIAVMREQLLPLATVVTPNLHEAEVLSGQEVSNVEEMVAAARRIKEFGPGNVIITGGHLKDGCVDIVYTGKEVYQLGGPRIESEHTHGSGCVFSSALAVFLAMGNSVVKGAEMARDFTRRAISKGLSVGKRPGAVQPQI
jgi:hydroxymethylpyrimidine kinase/phosphomethylpyrimidine kinase